MYVVILITMKLKHNVIIKDKYNNNEIKMSTFANVESNNEVKLEKKNSTGF